MYSHWLLIILFLDLFSTSLLIPFLPIHFRNVGLSQLLVGTFSSIYPSMQLFSSPSAGHCSDLYGPKQTLVISLVLCSFAYYFLASTFLVVIIFCRVALGLFKHTQTLAKTMFFESSKSEKHTMFGTISAVEAFGFMLGPVFGAHFIEIENGFQFLCNISTTIFILNAILTFYFLPDNIKHFQTNEKVNKSNSGISLSGVQERNIFWTEFWDIYVLKLIVCISLSLFYTNYAFIVTNHLKMPVSMVGYTNSFQGCISIITSLISGKVMNVNSSRASYALLNYCFLLLSFSMFCLSFVTTFSIFVLLLVPLISSSTLLRILSTELLLSRSTQKNKGALIGIENTISSVVFIISPFFFEMCTTNFGTSSVPMVTCLVTFVGASLSEYLHLSNKQITLDI